MRSQYLENPALVSDSWKAYFTAGPGAIASSGVTAHNQWTEPPLAGPASLPSAPATAAPAAAPATSAAAAPTTASAAAAPSAPVKAPVGTVPQQLKGVGARIVANMEASLTVPTATSVRDVAARLL